MKNDQFAFRRVLIVLVPFVLLGTPGWTEELEKPMPTHADVQYGMHERNVLDFWQTPQAQPAPLVIFIHGGGFREGSKANIPAVALREFLDAGISVAAINYRFRVHTPHPGAHHDARRALQFLRAQAGEWKIDKSRVGAFGGSAGAQLCMYLAFHDDQAQATSTDPIERESTRLTCVGTNDGQTTLDVDWWQRNIPGYDTPHQDFPSRFGLTDKAAYLAAAADVSALSLISADDPPIFMTYSMSPEAPVPEGEKAQGWQIHHVQFGAALKQKMDKLGLESHLVYPGHPDKDFQNVVQFLTARLVKKN